MLPRVPLRRVTINSCEVSAGRIQKRRTHVAYMLEVRSLNPQTCHPGWLKGSRVFTNMGKWHQRHVEVYRLESCGQGWGQWGVSKVKTQLTKLIWDPQRFTMTLSEVCKRRQTDIIKSDPERSPLVSLSLWSFLCPNWVCEPSDRDYWTSKGRGARCVFGLFFLLYWEVIVRQQEFTRLVLPFSQLSVSPLHCALPWQSSSQWKVAKTLTLTL